MTKLLKKSKNLMQNELFKNNAKCQGHLKVKVIMLAYQCKGLDQSNIVCEYEVNLSTNEKVITEKQNFKTNC